MQNQQRSGVALTPHQLSACQSVLSSHGATALLGGAAGTGKTTLIREIYAALQRQHGEVFVCTPTHKASQVLRRKGLHTASTYHSLLFTGQETPQPPKADGTPQKPILTFVANDKLESLGKGKRRHVPALIIDEASMVSSAHLTAMQRMCDKLVLVGDQHQLPPVEQGGGLGFFNSTALTAELTEVHRQADGSSILDLAGQIRRGENLDLSAFRPQPKSTLGAAIRAGVQVICYTNETRRGVNHAARLVLKRTSEMPEPGDRMIFGDTFTSGSNLWPAGTSITVVALKPLPAGGWSGADLTFEDEDGGKHQVPMNMSAFWFDLPTWGRPAKRPDVYRGTQQQAALQYAYAITAHKAQGSEYPHVLVIDERPRIFDADTRVMHETRRRWLYTSVTRAQKNLHIVDKSWLAKKAAP